MKCSMRIELDFVFRMCSECAQPGNVAPDDFHGLPKTSFSSSSLYWRVPSFQL